jgi:hypothetical protein
MLPKPQGQRDAPNSVPLLWRHDGLQRRYGTSQAKLLKESGPGNVALLRREVDRGAGAYFLRVRVRAYPGVREPLRLWSARATPVEANRSFDLVPEVVHARRGLHSSRLR